MDTLTHEQIKEFCQVGDGLLESGDYKAAIGQYNLAWELIPEPKNNWRRRHGNLPLSAMPVFLGDSSPRQKKLLSMR